MKFIKNLSKKEKTKLIIIVWILSSLIAGIIGFSLFGHIEGGLAYFVLWLYGGFFCAMAIDIEYNQ